MEDRSWKIDLPTTISGLPLRVLCVFGTRPEAIKMCPIVLGMKAAPKKFAPIVCVTGQHREMLRQVVHTFGVKPDYDLAVMRPDQSLAGMTARILGSIDRLIEKEKPDLLIVQGDTTTALAAGLAAFYRRVPVAHVEAGLRTGDFENPFPEELNRVLIDRFAAFCFAPTELNRRTLRSEGIPANRIFVTGNTGIDALLMIRARVGRKRAATWDALWRGAKSAVLVTAHRRESFGPWLRAMFTAILNLARKHPEWHFVYPVHLNPRVRIPAKRILAGLNNVHLIEPLPYEPFVFLMNRATLILTDSGGIQEEAPSLGKLVVVMRTTTERREAIEARTVTLAGNTGEGLEKTVERVMRRNKARPRAARRNPYGDGKAAERILRILWKMGAGR
jgi:UDP-N-acetylglucosamine 2-epimerase (non-hydrolysing)